ncbi:hypothetical protein P43SY_009468 [Pythium insidiosum]|uniref:TKL protein kinase n=1 Tax=Pythium insidiosum TaxID=114742 RepID=A0AAD5LCW0_PYTIN|nr:hypothetical protein P43SY_009468 [Pythium insidiosum]
MDAIMDVITMTALPVYLLLRYVRTFNFVDFNFTNSEWYNDVWIVNFMHDSQVVLTSSWLDMISRLILSTSVLSSLEAAFNLALVARDPALRLATASRQRNDSLAIRRFHRWSRYVLGLWGATVLLLHVHASRIPKPEACSLHVRPWLATLPSCAFVDVNCQNVVDAVDSVGRAIESVDAAVVVHLRVRHCSNVVMSSSLQTLTYLVGLKIYNSTVLSWPANAALTWQHHDHMRFAFFPRVVFPNATLPVGLISLDFPPKLNDLEFCGTNIAWIPDDLALAWASVRYLYMEQSPLTTVPLAFIRMDKLQYLSMADDLVTDIPMALLEPPVRRVLAFGGNPIVTLPDPDPTALPPGAYSMRTLLVDRTLLAMAPRWWDVVTTWVGATDTPVCDALANASSAEAQRPWAKRAICTFYRYGIDRPAALYPLHLEE